MASPMTVYSKKTCITCKKALAYLTEHNIPHTVKEITDDPPDKALLERLVDEFQVKASLNPRSTIYKEKQLGKTSLSKADAITLMRQDPNLIKRPVIVLPDQSKLYQGFNPDTLASFLNSAG